MSWTRPPPRPCITSGESRPYACPRPGAFSGTAEHPRSHTLWRWARHYLGRMCAAAAAAATGAARRRRDGMVSVVLRSAPEVGGYMSAYERSKSFEHLSESFHSGPRAFQRGRGRL
eukprot:26757-Chlamydomonas_euryale.AAC.2